MEEGQGLLYPSDKEVKGRESIPACTSIHASSLRQLAREKGIKREMKKAEVARYESARLHDARYMMHGAWCMAWTRETWAEGVKRGTKEG